MAGRPYGSLTDFWHRAGVSRPVAERLVLAGGVRLRSTASARAVSRRRVAGGTVTRRDLLLQVAELDRLDPGHRPGGPGSVAPARARPTGERPHRGPRSRVAATTHGAGGRPVAGRRGRSSR